MGIELSDYTYKLHTRGSHAAIFHLYRQEAGTTSYFQYVNDEGKWFLMKSVRAGAVTTHTFFYGGTTDIDTGWTNRATPGGAGYEVFNAAFD